MATYTSRTETTTINDPAAYLFLCNALRDQDREIRKNFYDSLRFGKRLGLIAPAGVVLASYSRWLETNSGANIERFFSTNDAKAIFAPILAKMHTAKVIYPEVFNGAALM